LVDHAEGTLAPAHRQRHRERLERHLARCPQCRADLTALRDIPAVLHTSAVADPGETFWRQQREAIGRAIRHPPVPGSTWNLDWLRDRMRLPRWRYALAVAASLLVALPVYRFAERTLEPQRDSSAAQIAALDADSLAALHDLMQAVAPADANLSASPRDDEVAFAAAEVGDLIGGPSVSDGPRATDLSDAELEGVDDLIGGVG
jgi:hypothetical protein